MAYNVSKLTTVADCDKATAMATERKTNLQFDQLVTGKGLTDQEKTTALANASMIAVKAQIAGAEAAIAVMPDGDDKDDLVNKLRRFNDKKDNLTERLQKGGTAALLDTELDAGLLAAQLTEIDLYLAAIATHKATL
jgi:hypothetical protein